MRIVHVCARTLCVVIAMSFVSVSTARAAYIINILQVGPDVVGTGSGSANTTGMTFNNSPTSTSHIDPVFLGGVTLGPTVGTVVDGYLGVTGPSSFGSGVHVSATSGSGPAIGFGVSTLFVPQGYVSGAVLAPSSATWSNHTFSNLGITPGTYNYHWGSGVNADTLTLQIGPVPEPASAGVLAIAGIAMLRRRRA
jgi:hypothetical protein